MAFDKPYVPRMMARMTLNLAVQNELLPLLSSVLGIMESYSQPHEITCKPEQMVRFLAAVSDQRFEGKRPSIVEMNIKYIDFKRDVIKTFVPHR